VLSSLKVEKGASFIYEVILLKGKKWSVISKATPTKKDL
jgi:hypothetical protein